MNIFKIKHGQYKAKAVIVGNTENILFLLPLAGWNLDLFNAVPLHQVKIQKASLKVDASRPLYTGCVS